MTTERLQRRFGVRSQILGWYALVVAGVLAISVLALRTSLVASIETRIDANLTQEASELRRLSDSVFAEAPIADPTAALLTIYDTFLRTNVPDRDEMFIAIVGGAAREVSADAPAPMHLDQTFVASIAQVGSSTWLTIDTAIGPARVLAVPTLDGDRTIGVFAIVRFTAADRAEVADATRRAAMTAVAALLAVSGLAWLVAGRVLRPLDLLARTAGDIAHGQLDRRLPVQGPREIASLIDTFNSMLDRLERVFGTQRQFLADAGHELRTPLTVISGHLELATTVDDLREARPLVLDEVDRMVRIVDDLRVIAQSDQPDFIRRVPVDLDELARSLLRRASVLGDQDWRLGGAPPLVVELDEQRISQAVLNLAANAARHTPDGGVVEIGAEHDASETRIWVRDEGEGIAERDHARIFERFARGSTQRAPGGSGGLGLAIVATIASAHGGRVSLHSDVGAGSTFTLHLPHQFTEETH